VAGGLASRGIINLREHLLRRKISTDDCQVTLNSPFLKVNIIKAQGAVFTAKDNLRFMSLWNNKSSINIILGKKSTLQIERDIIIANGSQIFVETNAFLRIGGKEAEPKAWIINAEIDVYKRVEIGKDCLIASGAYITDSDWHYIEYDGVPSPIQSDTIIGNHVWICPHSRILKGTTIGDGCIVGTNSLVHGGTYPENTLIAGNPAKVIKNNCRWKEAIHA
jgi:acetyltransferase-like isoleucine patch superfamily enzyme